MNTGSPSQPETYQYSRMHINNNQLTNRVITPGETTRADHSYCTSEVYLTYRSLAGTFYYPQARANGNFSGEDFQGRNVNYNVSLSYAMGTPNNMNSASDQGMVVMTLPQGNYTITPTVIALNPQGGTSNTELPPVELNVGCRQVMDLTTALQVKLADLPQETDTNEFEVNGTVNSSGEVTHIGYQHNEYEPATVCTGCGVDPTFTIPLTLDDGENQIVVTATDSQSEVSFSIQYNAPVVEEPPVESVSVELLGCTDISHEVSAGDVGAELDFEVSASGGCDDSVTLSCTQESGDFFSLGETKVDCDAYDSCGQQAECSFTVSVTESEEEESTDCRDQDGAIVVAQELEETMLWPPRHDLVNVGLAVTISGPCEELGSDDSVTEVWSDEPEVPEYGDGSGNFAPDAKDSEEGLRLRAERRGTEDGRVYLLITKVAGDDSAFACSAVVVSHSQRKADKEDVLLQAEEAVDYCLENAGTPPPDYYQHGVSEAIGPKQ